MSKKISRYLKIFLDILIFFQDISKSFQDISKSFLDVLKYFKMSKMIFGYLKII